MIFSDLTQQFFLFRKKLFWITLPFHNIFCIQLLMYLLLVLMFCNGDSLYIFNSFVVYMLLKQQIMPLNNYITVYNMLILISNV